MIEQIEFSPVNPFLVGSVSSDKTLRLWDIRANKGHNVKTEKMKGSNINMAWSRGGHYIAVGNKDDVVSIYNVAQEKVEK